MKPKLILTDEIKASLDYENTEYLMDLLFDLNKENGLTVITSTHDFEVAKSHNRIICSYTKKMDYFCSIRADVLGINLEDKEKKLRVRKPFLDMNSICLHALAILNNSLESDYGKALYAQCKIDVATIFDRLKGSFGM